MMCAGAFHHGWRGRDCEKRSEIRADMAWLSQRVAIQASAWTREAGRMRYSQAVLPGAQAGNGGARHVFDSRGDRLDAAKQTSVAN